MRLSHKRWRNQLSPGRATVSPSLLVACCNVTAINHLQPQIQRQNSGSFDMCQSLPSQHNGYFWLNSLLWLLTIELTRFSAYTSRRAYKISFFTSTRPEHNIAVKQRNEPKWQLLRHYLWAPVPSVIAFVHCNNGSRHARHIINNASNRSRLFDIAITQLRCQLRR